MTSAPILGEADAKYRSVAGLKDGEQAVVVAIGRNLTKHQRRTGLTGACCVSSGSITAPTRLPTASGHPAVAGAKNFTPATIFARLKRLQTHGTARHLAHDDRTRQRHHRDRGP